MRARPTGYGVRQELLHQMAAVGAEIRGGHRERRRADRAARAPASCARSRRGNPGSTANVLGVVPGAAVNPLASVSGLAALFSTLKRLRERRLLRQQQRDRLIDVGVAIDAVARANHQRRTGDRTQREAEARLEPAPVGRSASRIALPVTTGRMRRPGTPRRDVEIRRDGRTARSIGASYSQRTPAFTVRPGLDPPVVGDVGVVRRRREILVRVAERDRAGVRHAEQEVGEVGAGRAPVNPNVPRASCCERTSHC